MWSRRHRCPPSPQFRIDFCRHPASTHSNLRIVAFPQVRRVVASRPVRRIHFWGVWRPASRRRKRLSSGENTLTLLLRYRGFRGLATKMRPKPPAPQAAWRQLLGLGALPPSDPTAAIRRPRLGCAGSPSRPQPRVQGTEGARLTSFTCNPHLRPQHQYSSE
jgi:hypothetical protein